MAKETWWWHASVDSAVKEKRRCWKTWKKVGTKEEYQKAMCLAKHADYLAKFQGEKSVHNDELCLDDRARQAAWKDHY